jgi:hypothetical protein
LSFNWLLQYPDWIYWAALPALIIHQFEQFIYPGGLRERLNRFVFQSDDPDQPVTKPVCGTLNIPLLWLLFAAVAFVGGDFLWFTLPVYSILFVRALLHIFVSVIFDEYIPGLYTSIILLLPLCLYVYSFLLITWQADYPMLLMSIMAALVAHIVFISVARAKQKASRNV